MSDKNSCDNCTDKDLSCKFENACTNQKFKADIAVTFQSGSTGSFSFTFDSIPSVNTGNLPRHPKFKEKYSEAWKRWIVNRPEFKNIRKNQVIRVKTSVTTVNDWDIIDYDNDSSLKGCKYCTFSAAGKKQCGCNTYFGGCGSCLQTTETVIKPK